MTRLLHARELPTVFILLLGSLLFMLTASLWASGLLALSAGMAFWLDRAGLPGPMRLLAAALAGLAIAGIGLSILPWTNGMLLTLLLGAAAWLKLAERSGPRDRFVAALIGLWLVALGLLTLPSTLALIFIALTLTGLVWTLYRDGAGPAGPARRLGWASTVLPALVLAVLLFLFVPRITGNLGMLAFVFDLPFVIETEAEAARAPPDHDMGLDEFQQTSRESLRVLTADFSVGTGPFEKTAPPVEELYWRGPVFWTYEQTGWKARPGSQSRSNRMKHKLSGAELEAEIREATRISMYDVTVFPHRGEWLYSLEIPGFTPPSSYITQDWQLMNLNPVRELLTYKMLSYVEYRAGKVLAEEDRQMGLQLPESEEPRTIAMGRQLRAQYGDDLVEVARAGRALFDEGFQYDYGAPVIEGEDPIDRFLFETRQGYGMHFATAYALMMRAAGIPSRVVSGYHGGLYMFLVERVFVTQREAHAWAEIWLDEYGWVRMDVARATTDGDPGVIGNQQDKPNTPDEGTGAEADDPAEPPETAPEEEDPALSSRDWLAGFDARMQSRLLQATGLRANAGTLLLIGLGVALTLLVLTLAWRLLRRWLRLRALPIEARLSRAFCRALARAGAPARRPSEGLRSYAARVNQLGKFSASQAGNIQRVSDWLCSALYGRNPGPIPAEMKEFKDMDGVVRQYVRRKAD